MKIDLIKKPLNVTVVGGFPGFGLVGTITTEYLMDHIDDVENYRKNHLESKSQRRHKAAM